MKVTSTELSGVLIIEPKVFCDSRGFFFETFQAERYAEYGMQLAFVQDNSSRSCKGVLRGLHYQLPYAQGKLVWVTRGQVFDVFVDIRYNSPTFGKWQSIILDAEEPRQIYIPPGFAHGFCVLSDEADFHYKCTDYYTPATEKGVRWDDPELNISWPVANPVLSPKDMAYPKLRDIAKEELFSYEQYK